MNVLVISPHPDDETLGCGGALLSHRNSGDSIYWLICTNISNDVGWTEEAICDRQKEIDLVRSEYGFKEIFNLGLLTTKVDLTPFSDLVKSFSDIFLIVKPEVVYTPFIHDVHTDHQIIGKSIQSIIKWFRFPFIKKVLMYETLSETEFNFMRGNTFRPNVFVDISDFLQQKIKIMKIYKSELGTHPFPRSKKTIESLAYLRGSQSGFKAAEAFELIFERRFK